MLKTELHEMQTTVLMHLLSYIYNIISFTLQSTDSYSFMSSTTVELNLFF